MIIVLSKIYKNTNPVDKIYMLLVQNTKHYHSKMLFKI